MNFNELKPRKWIKASDFPDDQVAFDYWINIANQFPEISHDFLEKSGFSIEILSNFDSNSNEINFLEEISGVEEITDNDIKSKDQLFTSEIENKREGNLKYNLPSSSTVNLRKPNINLIYFYDKPINSTEVHSQDNSIDLFEPEKNSNTGKNDLLQVMLPIYSIKKHICNEKKEFFTIDDLKYAEIAQKVSKRYIHQYEKIVDKTKKPHKIIHEKATQKKISTKDLIENQVSGNFNNSSSINIKNTNCLYYNQYQADDISIIVENCFKIDEILFFIVSSKSKSNDINNNELQKICISESVMKKRFPNALLDYFEKNIVFK